MQLSGKQIKDKSINFNEKVELGVDHTIDFGTTTVTIDKTPSASNDVVNKAYVDSLGNSSNYIEPCDYISEIPITAYQKKESGKKVLCTNSSTPGIYVYNGSKFVVYSIWSNLLKTIPNVGLVPVVENGSVYVFNAKSSTDITFIQLPQSMVSYSFGEGLTSEDGKIIVNTKKIATVERVTSVNEDLQTLKNNPLVNTTGNGVTISNNEIDVNVEEPIYIEDNTLKISNANVNSKGLMSVEDYNTLHSIKAGDAKDWKENATSSARYIYNRPFYKEDVNLYKGEYSISAGSFYVIDNITLEVGNTYAIEIDNYIPKEAECTYVNSSNNKECIFDSNVSITQNADSSSIIVYNNADYAITLKRIIDRTNGDVHVLDKMYLPSIEVNEIEPTDPNSAAEYALFIGDSDIAAGDIIKIPKDKTILDAGSDTTVQADLEEGGKFGPGTEYEGKFEVGDIYLYFVVYLGGSPSDKTIYINVSSFVDSYKGSDTIDITSEIDSEGKKYKKISVAEDKTMLTPSLSVTWTYDSKTTTAKTPTFEEGTIVDFSGTIEWSDSETMKSPTETSGDWGTELKYKMEISETGITTKKSFSQLFKANKKGLEVVNSKVVKASGFDTKSISCSLNFGNNVYHGKADNIEESTIKTFTDVILSPFKSNQVKNNVTTSTSEYYIYAYPKSFGELKSIIQDDATPILGAFTKYEATFTNAHNVSVDYYIYRSNNLGAFNDAKLNFNY